jgi:hypothetical protein
VPPLRIGIPAGWIAQSTWDSQSINPVPLVALMNRQFDVVTLTDSAIPNEALLPRDAVLLTLSGVPLAGEVGFLPPSSPLGRLTSDGLRFGPSGVGGFTLVSAWALSADASWGYMLYGWVGPNAGVDLTLMKSIADTVQLG